MKRKQNGVEYSYIILIIHRKGYENAAFSKHWEAISWWRSATGTLTQQTYPTRSHPDKRRALPLFTYGKATKTKWCHFSCKDACVASYHGLSTMRSLKEATWSCTTTVSATRFWNHFFLEKIFQCTDLKLWSLSQLRDIVMLLPLFCSCLILWFWLIRIVFLFMVLSE